MLKEVSKIFFSPGLVKIFVCVVVSLFGEHQKASPRRDDAEGIQSIFGLLYKCIIFPLPSRPPHPPVNAYGIGKKDEADRKKIAIRGRENRKEFRKR